MRKHAHFIGSGHIPLEHTEESPDLILALLDFAPEILGLARLPQLGPCKDTIHWPAHNLVCELFVVSVHMLFQPYSSPFFSKCFLHNTF